MTRIPTVYDVAHAAGVSTATVSYTFRNPSRVKESTRELVLGVAQRLGYVPNASARNLARGRTGVLGLFAYDFLWEAPDRRTTVEGALPDGSEPSGEPYDEFRLFPVYLDEVQRGFELECWRRGFEIIISGRRGAAEDSAINEFAGRVDGLAVFPRRVTSPTLHHIARRIPVVELASRGATDVCSRIDVDNAGGIALLVEHLHQEHGHRTLRFVVSDDNADSAARSLAYDAAIERAGLPALPPLRQSTDFAGQLTALHENGDLPDALVCASDQVALEALDILHRLGLDVPQDIAVAGFDGILAGAISRPRLTTVRQPMSEIGRIAADLLIARSADIDLPNEAIVLPTRLLVRESCGCTSV
ncbi:LacI family transcriptional regulator [Microbacterium proteolyticum]|uniref:LacI family transcriptional regulator n=1 Tax=Microbacterium proteolyticum TaxID=1572644 RepID=A0A7W5CJK4_9MICO|nr:LacI family DNA-binding transcriptional regulator [Microbacterium proteolyticum]MBB3158881.1 LacI family transcriptional regulator [Microbacterium proteolyticum]